MDDSSNKKLSIVKMKNVIRPGLSDSVLPTPIFQNFPLIALESTIDGIITNSNNTFSQQLGYTANEVIGTRLESLMNGASQAYLKDQLLPGLPSKGFYRDIPCRILRRSGDYIDCQLSMFFQSRPSNEPKIQIFLLRTADDTETNQSFNKNVKELSDYKFALDESALVAFTDRRGTITFVNDQFCKISKYRRDELLGQTHSLVKSDHHPKEFYQDLWKTISAGRIWKGEIKNRAKDGTFYWVYTTIVPFMDDRGRPEKYIAIRHDITAQKSAESLKQEKELLERVTHQKSEFVANMSHEIRTPLAAIVGFADLIAGGIPEEEKGQFVKRIQSNASHLQKLINDVLDLSKVEAGKLDIDDIQFDIREHFTESLSSLHSHTEKRGLEFSIEFDSSVPRHIVSDPARLRQILLNIVGNAVKFTNHGGIAVRVTLAQDRNPDSLVKIEVTDTGRGIPTEHQGKLFRPFTQSENSISRIYGGTGLGLALSRNLARALGGDLVLVSSEKGVGSKFEITINAGLVDAESVVFEEAKYSAWEILKQESRALAGYKILLVEDSDDIRLLGEIMLKSFGANVVSAENGEQGVLAANEQFFDVILMDIQMPMKDGFQAMHELRSDGYFGPILALTARSLKEERERCLAEGFDDCITKPYRPHTLVQNIKKWALNR